MKKVMISLLIGSILIGVGTVALFLEVSEYSMQAYRQDVLQQSTQTVTLDKQNFPDNVKSKVEIDGYIGYYFENEGKFEVILDKEVTDGFVADIYYKGTKPYVYGNNLVKKYDDDYDVVVPNMFVYNIFTKNSFSTPKEFLDAVTYVFKNKMFIADIGTYLVEKVVIRTSDPQRIVNDFN